MTWADFDRWSPHSVRGGAAQLVASGLLPEPEATAQVAGALADLLPDGIATPLHLLRTVRSTGPDGATVGSLWMRVGPSGSEVEAFVLDVEILPERRGRGWGLSTMLAAEQAARDLGASVVRLNVFVHNTAAVRVYERLGYAVAGATLTRRLDEQSVRPAGRPAQGSMELHPMGAEQYAAFRDGASSGRAGVRTGCDARSPDEARRRVRALDRSLPDGPVTPDHYLWVARDGTEPVAQVWLRLARRSDGCHAFLHELRPTRLDRLPEVVDAVERSCRALGAGSLTLSVPECLPTRSAPVLVERCGFRVAAQTMAKAM